MKHSYIVYSTENAPSGWDLDWGCYTLVKVPWGRKIARAPLGSDIPPGCMPYDVVKPTDAQLQEVRRAISEQCRGLDVSDDLVYKETLSARSARYYERSRMFLTI